MRHVQIFCNGLGFLVLVLILKLIWDWVEPRLKRFHLEEWQQLEGTYGMYQVCFLGCAGGCMTFAFCDYLNTYGAPTLIAFNFICGIGFIAVGTTLCCIARKLNQSGESLLGRSIQQTMIAPDEIVYERNIRLAGTLKFAACSLYLVGTVMLSCFFVC